MGEGGEDSSGVSCAEGHTEALCELGVKRSNRGPRREVTPRDGPRFLYVVGRAAVAGALSFPTAHASCLQALCPVTLHPGLHPAGCHLCQPATQFWAWAGRGTLCLSPSFCT